MSWVKNGNKARGSLEKKSMGKKKTEKKGSWLVDLMAKEHVYESHLNKGRKETQKRVMDKNWLFKMD